MFGLEVLVWHSELEDNKSYFTVLKKYLFGDAISHTALKITIPATPENDKLVQQYCCHLPHFKTSVALPEKVDSSVSYRPKSVPAWIIYFSRWPNKFAREYEDRVSASVSMKSEIDGRWAGYFENKQRTGSRGMMGYWLGKNLYNFCFGKPGKVQIPLKTFVHPHPEQHEWMERIKSAETAHEDILMKNIEALKACCVLDDKIEFQMLRILNLQRRFKEWHYFWDENQELKELDKIRSLIKEVENCSFELDKIKQWLEENEPVLKKAKQDLTALEDIYYSQVATIGCRPSRLIHLPIQGINTAEQGFSLEKMLEKMHELSLPAPGFSIIFNNCSHGVQDVLLAGLTLAKRQELLDTGLMKSGDFNPSLIAYPEEIIDLSLKLETAWLTLRLSTLLVSAPQGEESLENSKAILVTSDKKVVSDLQLRNNVHLDSFKSTLRPASGP